MLVVVEHPFLELRNISYRTKPSRSSSPSSYNHLPQLQLGASDLLLQSRHRYKFLPPTTRHNMASNLSRKDLLGKVYKMVPPMLEKFHKGSQSLQA